MNQNADKAVVDLERRVCGLAHRLKNTLSVIVLHCELLEDQLVQDGEPAERLHTIHELARSMAEEINQFTCPRAGPCPEAESAAAGNRSDQERKAAERVLRFYENSKMF